MVEDWRSLNLANWEARVPLHVAPGGYDLAGFDDPRYLSSVVRYDLPRLGDIANLDVVHLQCHIGTDTVSLARLGPRSVTGLDFSPSAIAAARDLAARTAADAAFVEGDVYDAVATLGTQCCDVVYTGIGAICWLPDIRRWAAVVAGLLRPGGRLFMREGHPMLDTLSDTRPDDLLVVHYPYFETAGTAFTEESTYGGAGVLSAPQGVSFNHGLGEVFTALTDAGLTVTALEEHREVPWNALGDAMVESAEYEGEYVLAQNPERLPLTYTIQARKL
ncbi:methyltransferase [Mycobacterium adipatum]|uniref:Methyltransferase n=1 Tax=Mycobacterium adipatum TaxID=1682113 RepID=A0A172UGV4_9MYCO|nr:class I SAM-dependent methyltransferase [Mycobacterium adipatum]ANE78367.1 methyltransferase [Mycobacterium adipatum]